jgi:hypothetical protein
MGWFMSNSDPVYASRFNYWDEIQPAMTDFTAETAMAMRLVNEDGLPLDKALRIVQEIVHVSKHYTVVDGPAPVNPLGHEQTK